MDSSTQTPQQSAVALARQPRDIKDLIKSADFEAACSAALPKHLTVQRFMRVALNATMRQPDLLKCSKESFFLRMLELSALGIEPDGRRAHLIPRKNNSLCGNCGHPKDQHSKEICRVPGCAHKSCGPVPSLMEVGLIVDYKGVAELVRRSGDVSYMHADAVYSKDEFDFKYGSGAFLTHRPDLKSDNRGTLLAFYSFVKLRDGNEDFIVMSRQEVEKVRSVSQYPNGGPWTNNYDEMGKKSVFRRHSKWLPLSPESREAVEADDDASLDLDGAITIAADNATVDYDRMERQMEEQGRAATSTSEGTEERQQRQTETNEDYSRTSAPSGLRWRDASAMTADFQAQRERLGDIAFYRICGSNGLGSDEDMAIGNPAVMAAYKEMLGFQTAGPSGDDSTPNFKPRRNR